MKKPLALLLCSAMVVGALVGCGSKKEETKAAETTAETTAETAGETGESKEAAEGEKTWIVATDTVFKPFEYTDENGDFVGIDVDILQAISEDQGFKYELNPLGFDAAAMAVQAGQADAIIAGATIKQERIDSGWIFSEGYYNATQTFAVAKGSDIKSFEDLSGKNVAVKQGTAGKDFADSLKDEYGFTVTVFEDSPSMYQDVVIGNSPPSSVDMAILKPSPSLPRRFSFGTLTSLKINSAVEEERIPILS